MKGFENYWILVGAVLQAIGALMLFMFGSNKTVAVMLLYSTIITVLVALYNKNN